MSSFFLLGIRSYGAFSAVRMERNRPEPSHACIYIMCACRRLTRRCLIIIRSQGIRSTRSVWRNHLEPSHAPMYHVCMCACRRLSRRYFTPPLSKCDTFCIVYMARNHLSENYGREIPFSLLMLLIVLKLRCTAVVGISICRDGCGQ